MNKANLAANELVPEPKPKELRNTPLRVQFVLTSLPVGGAEVLLLNLLKRLDRSKIAPEVICLKDSGELGESVAAEVPLKSNFLSSKWDLRVFPRLVKHLRNREADAVVTIGAGDKMFWGRLAANFANVPVVCSALHSTGWPDGVGFANRLLTGITDGFIAVAQNHAQHLVRHEKFPAEKVFTIPNGIDTERFRPNQAAQHWLRKQLNVPTDANLIGIVAALREEKNHRQFVDAGAQVLKTHSNTHFVIVGDGPERSSIEERIGQLGLSTHFHLLGTRSDTEQILPGLDVFCLTSRNEANPVSILEALSCGVAVVSPDVGSISETVLAGQTGILTKPLDAGSTSEAISCLLSDGELRRNCGLRGRELVRKKGSLDAMTAGYERLLAKLYNSKAIQSGWPRWEASQSGGQGQIPDEACESRHQFEAEHISL